MWPLQCQTLVTVHHWVNLSLQQIYENNDMSASILLSPHGSVEIGT